MVHLLVERNPAIAVDFAGLRSDTHTLGRCGWRVAIEQRDLDDTVMVICHHEPTGLTLAGSADLRRLRPYEWSGRSHPPIFLRQCSVRGHSRMSVVGPVAPAFAWVETQPALIEMAEHDIYNLPLFAALNEPAGEQLIVDPLTVSQLLDQIRHMQAPEQADIRARERRRERHSPPRLHAQILSFAA